MKRTLLVGALAGLTLLGVACGDDDDDTTAATDPAASTDAAAVPTTASPSAPAGSEAGTGAVPSRIVSLSPTHTEILFAIGAGDQVIAVDDQSNYPPEAESLMTDLSGFEPNVEAIAGYEPDLVVTSGGGDLAAQLDALDIEVWEGPAAVTLDDAYAQIEQLGAVTGHVAEAAELVGSMQADIEEIVAATPPVDPPLTVYHELSPDGFSADSTTFIGQVYSLLGLQNIADTAEGDSGGYPQLNSEAIISQDPDLIFLADSKCCGENVDTVAARDGWAAITAVVDGLVFTMDDDVASRWGPRVVDYLREVAAAVEQAAAVPAGG